MIVYHKHIYVQILYYFVYNHVHLGCGRHIETILAGVPQSERCQCPVEERGAHLRCCTSMVGWLWTYICCCCPCAKGDRHYRQQQQMKSTQ